MCARVCTCVRLCVLVPTVCACVHLCVNVCVYLCACVYLYVPVRECVCLYVHTCVFASCVSVHRSVCACVCVSVVREKSCSKDSRGEVPRKGCRLCSGSHIFLGRWSYPQVQALS